MFGKVVLFSFSIIVAGVYLNGIFSDLYIPSGYEKPGLYKIQYALFQILTFSSKLADYFEYMDETVFFKHQITFLESLAPKFEPKENGVKILDEFADGVPIRLFYKNTTENLTSLPVFIYYHGGGYVFNYGRAYDIYLNYIAERLDILIIAILYRTAPEYPYPAAINDCWTATNFLIENPEKFKINKDKIIIGGDSCGGGLTAAISQKLVEQNKKMPILQILVYPWLQMFNFRLPSSIEYKSKSMLRDLLSLTKFSMLYFGAKSHKNESYLLDTNQHTFLVENEDERKKFKEYFNINLIPNEYRIGRSYYDNFNINEMYPNRLNESSQMISNLELRNSLKNAFNLNSSVSLADDEVLKTQPKSYFIIFEWDSLKDEALIYAERLRRNGVHVNIAFYEKIFHGGALFIEDLNISRKILDNMIEYISQNV